ncbi:MAG TPA: O-antigen ligase family protein [Patescibacteria group bacterium]|nr:O-antigen ligase family protein [Patescibacteria group bacterium]
MTATPRTSPIALAAWFAVALGTAWLVGIGGGFYGIYVSELRVISVAMAAIALGAWGVAAVRNPSWRPRSAIWPAIAVSLAAFAVTTLTSERPSVSAEYLAYATLLAALYLLLRALMAHIAFRNRIAGLSVLLALGVGVAFMAACAGHWIDWWGIVGTIRVPPLRPYFEGLTYGNPSAVMTMSVLLTAAAAAHLGLGTRGRRAAVVGLIVLAAAATLLSGSRAGWLAIAITSLAVGVAAVASPTGRQALGELVRGRNERRALVTLALAGGAGVLILAPSILQRAAGGGEDLRATYVAVAGRMFVSAPITGHGAGTWVADRIALTQGTEPDYYIPHAHNLYAQTVAEHGLAGLLAGAIAIGCLAWLILGGMRDPDARRRRWGWAALFVTVYFGAHQLLDFYANMPAAIFAFAVPIAWLDATAPRSITARRPALGVPPRARRLLGGVAATAGVGVMTVAIAGLMAPEAAAQAMAEGRAATRRGDWTAALPLFRIADEAQPAIPAYAFARGLAEARHGDPAAALTALTSVGEADDLPVAWLNVAALRLDARDATGAREALDRALRLGLQQPAIVFAAGTLLERLEDRAGADVAWFTTLRALPSLAGDPWWSDPARAARWTSIRDAALAEMAPESAADLWLSSGDVEQASASAARIGDPAARRRTELAIAAWDGDAADRAALHAFAQDHPFDLVAVAWAGRVAARAGDRAAVSEYRLWANTVVGTAAAAVGEIRVAPAGSTVSPAGLTGTFWGQYTYRRPTPADQLVPALPSLVLTP